MYELFISQTLSTEIAMNLSSSVQATKHKLVSEILANRTYTPQSGLWCRLYNQLIKLSKDDLSSLKVVIACKVTDCGGTGLVKLEDQCR